MELFLFDPRRTDPAKTKRPVTLVYYEGYATKEEAMSREYAIKQLTRAKKLALMEF